MDQNSKPTPVVELGQVAYEAYCDARDWQSFNGDTLPDFVNQSPALRAAWAKAEIAAQQVVAPKSVAPPVGSEPIFNDKDLALIRDTKTLRVELDGTLQKMKLLPGSRELAIAVTNLQQSIMWLGMVLKAIGTPTPYPNSYLPANAIVDKTADGLKL